MNQKYASVSIIISTYNWPEALETALKALALQTVMPDEVVIADDGSGQETSDLISKMQQEMPYKIYHVWQEHDGFRAGQIRNKAIAKASGEYLIQIDGDMVPEKHFVEDHLNISKKGTFVVGSRVNTRLILAQKILKSRKASFSFFTKGAIDRFNLVRCKVLTNYYEYRYKRNDPYYARGCNMAYWREDVIAVNGYNEDMIGWGREDSELAVRLLSLGRKKLFLKFGAVAYHLHHFVNSRERESINIGIWEETIKSGIIYTPNGLNKYLKD